ncbi:uncharacterized protein LOC111894732 [Lactuca sativa]|nr:uncharacterized protein LOC111894732 [Lactuca sativa]
MHPRLFFLSAFSFYLLSTCSYITRAQKSSIATTGVNLTFIQKHVVMSNGIVQVTLQNPEGHITRIQYKGIDNLLEVQKNESSRGYWDVVWSPPGSTRTEGTLESVTGTICKVIKETQDQVEVSFSRTWNFSLKGKSVPLKIDKRYIMLRGSSGFYTYAIFEHVKGWPSFDLEATRVAFKLRRDKFHYMAMSNDDRQRDMPLPEDRFPERSKTLDYPEAVLLVDPLERKFKGQVDDKYQYTCELKDLRVHGWICTDPAVGFWQITPSNEFRVGGPIKQELTSHVGPTTLSIFSSAHYGGNDMVIKFEENESWKKVLGPIFIYLNTIPDGKNPYTLWNDAKHQMSIEVDRWPYDFPASPDFQSARQRGTVMGRLLVQDSFINSHGYISANGAYIGLAPPGDVGSWQRETKQYQFWTKTNKEGYFTIKNIIVGEYNLYAWVPGFIGDYKNSKIINITPGVRLNMGELVYHPPRYGPTLWAIGFPDRTAAEFHIPDPQPKYANSFLLQGPNRFRQYGLWNRYSELYPNQDLVYTIGESNYGKDFFFAHVLREADDGTYKRTTWTINFRLDHVNESGAYVLRLALASAHQSNLQVRINDLKNDPLFSTGFIGGDNAIARHGIHGLYWLFSIKIPGSHLYSHGLNSIYLTQASNKTHFQGVMYDYIRLEGPSSSIVNKIS